MAVGLRLAAIQLAPGSARSSFEPAQPVGAPPSLRAQAPRPPGPVSQKPLDLQAGQTRAPLPARPPAPPPDASPESPPAGVPAPAGQQEAALESRSAARELAAVAARAVKLQATARRESLRSQLLTRPAMRTSATVLPARSPGRPPASVEPALAQPAPAPPCCSAESAPVRLLWPSIPSRQVTPPQVLPLRRSPGTPRGATRGCSGSRPRSSDSSAPAYGRPPSAAAPGL